MARSSTDVLAEEKDGVTAWLWSRWRSLASAGLERGGARADRAGLPARALALAGRRADLGAVLLRPDRSHQPASRGRWRRPDGVSAPEPPAAIALHGVTVRREGVPVLQGIDWRVDVGDRWVVLGPNGSGKTTLLQVAGARLWPTAGTVEVLGARLGAVDVRTLRPACRAGQRRGHPAAPADLPARDVVVSGRHGALETWWNRYTAEDWEKADALLALGGVGDLGDRPFGVISEGERQQVLLARALMSDPELLLLDEPFAGLDLGARERLLGPAHGSGRRPGQPADRPRHAPLRGDPARVHPRRLWSRAVRWWRRARCADVVTSEHVSACFGVAVTVGCTDGRWWSRAV